MGIDPKLHIGRILYRWATLLPRALTDRCPALNAWAVEKHPVELHIYINTALDRQMAISIARLMPSSKFLNLKRISISIANWAYVVNTAHVPYFSKPTGTDFIQHFKIPLPSKVECIYWLLSHLVLHINNWTLTSTNHKCIMIDRFRVIAKYMIKILFLI